MAGKQNAYCGLVTTVPGTESFEASNTTKSIYNDYGGGCSSRLTEKRKAGEFVDRRNGNQGFKEEVKYNSSYNVNDKIHGCTTQYETQVNFKKVTTYANPSKSYGSGGGGSKNKSVKYNYY